MTGQPVPLIPSASQIHQLREYLAANVALSRANGAEQKSLLHQEMLDTVTALAQLAAQPSVVGALEEGRRYGMPELTRVTLVDQDGVVFEDYELYPTGSSGAELMVQDQGRTLKVWPATRRS